MGIASTMPGEFQSCASTKAYVSQSTREVEDGFSIPKIQISVGTEPTMVKKCQRDRISGQLR